jgi:hypothetical protein
MNGPNALEWCLLSLSAGVPASGGANINAHSLR